MKRRMNFSVSKKVRSRSYWTVILSLSAAALLLLSFAASSAAVRGEWGKANTITGKVVDIDASQPTKSLTIKSGELGLSPPNNEINIFLNDKTVVKMCYAANSSLKNLKDGDSMQVTYHEIAGLAVADFIYKPC